MSNVQTKDRKTYSVYELLVAGSRFTDDYDEVDALDDYMALHPDADRAVVAQELKQAIAAEG